jgi:predicted nucleic acid-binding protein
VIDAALFAGHLVVRDPRTSRRPLPLARGEDAVIALASELTDGIAAIDDLRARSAAQREGVRITGTVGILLAAHPTVDALELIERLRDSGFRLSDELVASVRRQLEPR